MIVVDNGSTDGTLAALRSTGVKVLENGENRGFARAVNRGIHAAPAKNDIVLLNNDVRITQSDWLDRLRACAERERRVGVVAARLIYPDGRLQDAGIRVVWEPLCMRHYGAGERDVGQFCTVRSVPAVSFACVYLRREALQTVGLLDEDYFCYFEDVDLCLRMRRAGFGVFCCGEVSLVHEENATSAENDVQHQRVFTQAQRVFEQKWPAPPNPPRGEILALGYPGPDPESISVIRHVLYGLEDLGWRMSYRNRLAWGSPLDRIEVSDDWEAFSRAQQFRVPSHGPRPLLLGSPLGIALEGSPGACAFVANGFGDRVQPAESLPPVAWLGLPWATQEHVRLQDRPIEVIPPPVDFDYFFPASRDGTKLPPNRPLTFLALEPWSSGPELQSLIRAFRQAFSGSSEARLLYVACGPEPPPRANGTDVEMRWLPWLSVAERAFLYRSADAFVALRPLDPWGLYLLEAAHCGLPIVATLTPSLQASILKDCIYPVPCAAASQAGPERLHRNGQSSVQANESALTASLRAVASSFAEAASRATRAREKISALGPAASVLTRISDGIERYGREEPQRFSPGKEPPPGPLASPMEAERILEIFPPGSLDPEHFDRTDYAAGRPELAAARLATLAVANLHLKAGVENLVGEVHRLIQEVTELRLKTETKDRNRPITDPTEGGSSRGIALRAREILGPTRARLKTLLSPRRGAR